MASLMVHQQKGQGPFLSPLVLEVFGMHCYKTRDSFGLKLNNGKEDEGALALSAVSVRHILTVIPPFHSLTTVFRFFVGWRHGC